MRKSHLMAILAIVALSLAATACAAPPANPQSVMTVVGASSDCPAGTFGVRVRQEGLSNSNPADVVAFEVCQDGLVMRNPINSTVRLIVTIYPNEGAALDVRFSWNDDLWTLYGPGTFEIFPGEELTAHVKD